MHKEFADAIQNISEHQGEVTPEQIYKRFKEMYIEANEPLHFKKVKIEDISDLHDTFDTKVVLTYTENGIEKTIEGFGNGPIDAVKHGLNQKTKYHTKLTLYSEHALTMGSDSQAATYIQLMNAQTGETAFGVGVSSNITRSSIRAIFSALNRLFYK